MISLTRRTGRKAAWRSAGAPHERRRAVARSAFGGRC
jgi:hypothetical protein